MTMNSTINLKFMGVVVVLIFALAFYVGFQFNTSGDELIEENKVLQLKIRLLKEDSRLKDSIMEISFARVLTLIAQTDSLQKLYDDEDSNTDADIDAINNIPVSALADSLESRYK